MTRLAQNRRREAVPEMADQQLPAAREPLVLAGG